ncbi:MAG: PAS domain S-box protein [Methanoregula sp.]|nr:PAS domain S-box protein [Methanoregula sp.]
MINTTFENSLISFVESLNQVCFTLDDRGTITSVSSGCTALLGFLPEEMIGKSISVFVKPEDRDRVGAMSGPEIPEKNVPFSFHVVGTEGSVHPARAISRSVSDVVGNTCMIGFIGESGNGNPAEHILCQTNAKIHQLNSIVRHDINNQLTILNGYLSLMEQDDSAISSREIVKILLCAADKIHNMVTFTKEYKDAGTRLPMWMNLGKVFQSAQSTSAAAGVRITTDPACDEVELFFDPILPVVFEKLIDNSLIHGEHVSEISLHWRRDANGVLIVYEDNGTGIPDAVRPSLFCMGKGTKNGYSLFLVREILAISGFTISETGIPGKCARFVIAVPAGSFRQAKTKQQ